MFEQFLKKTAWLGHDTFRIDGEKVIYIDPFQLSTDKKADIILITHEHHDHCSPEDVEKIQKADTIIVTEKDSAKKLSGDIRVIAPGESMTVSGIKVEAVPAYNIDKAFHPKEKEWLGFIFEVDGIKIYHTGDTDFIPEMKEFESDIAMIPVSGTYVMTAEQAVEATLALKPKLAIPMHYGAIVGSDDDAVRYQSALAGKIEVKVMSRQTA